MKGKTNNAPSGIKFLLCIKIGITKLKTIINVNIIKDPASTSFTLRLNSGSRMKSTFLKRIANPANTSPTATGAKRKRPGPLSGSDTVPASDKCTILENNSGVNAISEVAITSGINVIMYVLENFLSVWGNTKQNWKKANACKTAKNIISLSSHRTHTGLLVWYAE